MKLGLGVKVGTNLSLTPQLQQAIRMLQLSNMELNQEIEKELVENPLLEKEYDYPDVMHETHQNDEQQHAIDGLNSAPETELSQQLSDTNIKDDLAIDTKWDDVYIHESTKWDRAAASDFDFEGQTDETLKSHIEGQMRLTKLSPVDEYICQQLIDCLDDRGFINVDMEEMQQNISTELAFLGIDYELDIAEILVVLRRIQLCEPIGVGARDLSECLQLQLRAFHSEHIDFDKAMKLLEHHECLIKNDLKKLLKQTGMSIEELQSGIALVRTLNPFPCDGLFNTSVDYQIPDVIVKKVSDTWQVQLNGETLPRLKVNQSYAGLVNKQKKDQASEFIKKKSQDAKQFIKSIEERNNSLLKVTTAILEKQHQFFEEGVTALKPLILKEIADMVDLHESTVSRITSNKYVLTNTGLYSLKYFFSSGVGNDAGGESSSTAICAYIKELIEAEDSKKPLSDSKICNLLQNKGINVARRTVAKYRESLGYPSSTQRKNLL